MWYIVYIVIVTPVFLLPSIFGLQLSRFYWVNINTCNGALLQNVTLLIFKEKSIASKLP